MKKIIAISGSTRQQSSNHLLIKAIREITTDIFNITLFEGLTTLPHFDPDRNTDNTPEAVEAFRKAIDEADGVIICTPEYAHGVPGSLKNAIDWTVSTNQFSQKPTLLITASSDGRFGHAALMETLRVIEAYRIDELQLLIQFVQTKISKEGIITDPVTLEKVKEKLELFRLVLAEERTV